MTAAAPHTAADDTFLAAVLARPDDALPKLIYGDFLEEQDRCDEAEFWRWLAAAGTWPERSRHVEEYWCWNRAGGYWAEPQHETPPESVVPQKLFWEVPDRITDCSEHRSARDALLALLDAWLRLPAGQRPKA